MPDWKGEFERVVKPAIAQSQTIRELLIEQGALAQAGAVARRHFDGDKVVVFADDAGYAAAGQRVVQSLEAAGFAVSCHVLAVRPLPKPTVAQADEFRALLTTPGVIPVALGSGVINDLVKYAARCADIPYFSIATAASMDGYASAGAPLIRDGFKITIPARAPRAILADLDIIAAAPVAMTSWGYGDLAGKVPAGGDWILADALGIEAIDDKAWPLVQDNLSGWLADPAALANGDLAAIARLFSGLIAAGLAMEFHGSSRPASGADHQIAHLWEMENLTFQGQRVSHGACVAVGCMTVLRLFDWLLKQDLTDIDPHKLTQTAPSLAQKYTEIEAVFDDPRIIARAKDETAEKHASPKVLGERLATLRAIWPDLQARLRAHLMRSDQMAKLLRTAGAQVGGAEIGVDPKHLRKTIKASRFIRARYTLPDLLDETGLLDQAVVATTGRPVGQDV